MESAEVNPEFAEPMPGSIGDPQTGVPRQITVNVMHEWSAGPLWADLTGPGVSPIELDEIPLSADLARQLAIWQTHFENHCHLDYVDGSDVVRWDSDADDVWSYAEGLRLARELDREFGGRFRITYNSKPLDRWRGCSI